MGKRIRNKRFVDLKPGDMIPISSDVGISLVISCRHRLSSSYNDERLMNTFVDYVILNTKFGLMNECTVNGDEPLLFDYEINSL